MSQPKVRSRNPDIRALLRIAKKAGWEITRSKGGHIKCKDPKTGYVTYTSATAPAGARSVVNFRAQLRRGGLKC